MEDFARASAAGDAVELNVGRHRPAVVVDHPVDVMQRTHAEIAQQFEMGMYRNVYGAHFPEMLRAQEVALVRVGRAPNLPSSRVALEILRGTDESIDFCDVLGDDESGSRGVDLHLAMEKRLGIQKTQYF